MNTLMRHAGWVAAASCASAAIGFGAMLEGYSHTQHPLAVLGASGMPGAMAFNVFAYLVPGIVAAALAFRLRSLLPDDAKWAARIGAWLVLLSACAFAAQGLLPLDVTDLEAPASQRHASMWMLWLLGFGAGAGLLGLGAWRQVHWRQLAVFSAVSALTVPAVALFAGVAIGAGTAQRLAFGMWFGWLLLVAATESAGTPGDGANRPLAHP